MRTILFGDGDWAADSLARLVEENVDVAAVVLRSDPTDPTLPRSAKEHAVEILQPEDANDRGFIEDLQGYDPDLLLSIAYDQIFGDKLLQVAPLGIVNFHAGMLPRYRGRNVINWAIINGETEIGITSHYVDDGIDTGPVLLQRSLPIRWTDNYGDVLDRVVAAFPDLVVDTVQRIAEGRDDPTPQDDADATYFSGRGPGDEWMDWSDRSEHLHNKVRAIARPGPGARTVLDGDLVVVWEAYYDPDWPNYRATPGQVVGKEPGEGVHVKTGDSTLLVTEAQVGDGPATRPEWPIGTRLGVAPVRSANEDAVEGDPYRDLDA